MKKYIWIIGGLVVVAIIVIIAISRKSSNQQQNYPPNNQTIGEQPKPNALDWVNAFAPILLGAAAVGSQTNWFGLGGSGK